MPRILNTPNVPSVQAVIHRVFNHLMELVDLIAFMRRYELDPYAGEPLLNAIKAFANEVDFCLAAGRDINYTLSTVLQRHTRRVVRQLEALAPRGEGMLPYAPTVRYVLNLLMQYQKWAYNRD